MSSNFRLTYASVSLGYAPLPRFESSKIKSFAAEIDAAHPFESTRVIGDSGGILETDGRRWLRIERDGLELQERSVDEGWELVKKQMIDLLGTAMDRFEIPFAIPQEILLRALWPIPNDRAASELMQESALGVRDGQYKILGEDVRGGSVTVVGSNEEPDFRWSVEIAPYLTDETQIWVEVEANPIGFGRVEEIAIFLDGAYEFLDDKVMKFIESVLH